VIYREELSKFARSYHTRVIISYHNFIYTPSQDYLDIIIKESKKWNADRVKIATTATNKSDCSTVMGLYARHNNIIAFCMGEQGKITRLAAPLLGADFTFASWNDTLATAPGQLTVEEMKKIYNIL
jgi:3-dehydroquinate dehydratase-1